MLHKKKFRFNWNLAQRFVNDYRLPIPIMGEKMFKYHLNLYENKFGCKSKWFQLWDLIDQRFGGNPEKFLEEFYAVRENVIQTVSTSAPFLAFNTCDMSVYPKKETVSEVFKSLQRDEHWEKVCVNRFDKG